MKTLPIAALAVVIAASACAKKKESAAEESAAQAATSATAATSAAATASASQAERPSLPAPDNVAAAPESAEKTASGLASVVLQAGQGTDKPQPEDRVVVHYTGWTSDGKMFDSSVLRKQPATFGVTQVIKGWTEGLQLMTPGEKRRFWIPAELAYGKEARGGRPAGQLTFDVELIEIKHPPKAPSNLDAPPPTAKKTKSGLVYDVLTKGTGTVHPDAESRVQVNYSGWTLDGKMFDSSVLRGRPASFGLNHVIPGWTEGLQLMVEGEKTRFWIPAELAYGENPGHGRPAGKLVFDVELLKIYPKPAAPAAHAPAKASGTPAAAKPVVAKPVVAKPTAPKAPAMPSAPKPTAASTTAQ